jgi:hypothetical protein
VQAQPADPSRNDVDRSHTHGTQAVASVTPGVSRRPRRCGRSRLLRAHRLRLGTDAAGAKTATIPTGTDTEKMSYHNDQRVAR